MSAAENAGAEAHLAGKTKDDYTMIVYKNLSEVLVHADELDKLGTLYINRKLWKVEPARTEVILLIGDDELEDLNEDGVPILAAANNISYFLDVEIFQNVIDLLRERMPNPSVDDYVYAINYYLENDDFY